MKILKFSWAAIKGTNENEKLSFNERTFHGRFSSITILFGMVNNLISESFNLGKLNRAFQRRSSFTVCYLLENNNYADFCKFNFQFILTLNHQYLLKCLHSGLSNVTVRKSRSFRNGYKQQQQQQHLYKTTIISNVMQDCSG